jgi:hypothetical protein
MRDHTGCGQPEAGTVDLGTHTAGLELEAGTAELEAGTVGFGLEAGTAELEARTAWVEAGTAELEARTAGVVGLEVGTAEAGTPGAVEFEAGTAGVVGHGVLSLVREMQGLLGPVLVRGRTLGRWQRGPQHGLVGEDLLKYILFAAALGSDLQKSHVDWTVLVPWGDELVVSCLMLGSRGLDLRSSC